MMGGLQTSLVQVHSALNSEMRWCALLCGNVYVRQHSDDARLTVEALRDMVGHEGNAFSNKVLRYASSLRGTRQYGFKQGLTS